MKQPPKGLTEKQKAFCRLFVMDWNTTKAYREVYKCSTKAAESNGARLIRNDKVKAYCDDIVKDLEKLCGVSKQRNVNELAKLAYSSTQEIFEDWITLSDFKKLPKEIKSAIECIDTKTEEKNNGTKEDPDWVTVKYVKVKFHSKIEALKELAKEMGWHAAEKVEHSGKIAFEEIPIINLKRRERN